MLVTSKELFEEARAAGYAVPAPDFIDLDSARTYVAVAEEVGRPIVLSFAQAHRAVISLAEAALIGTFLAGNAKVPIVLHLDHGTDFGYIKQAIRLGFTSVMIDASTQPLAENIKRTKEVVGYAHRHGVVVEAEIGHVGSGGNSENQAHSDSIGTDVDEAVTFVRSTGVDSLAVSIGTAHGVYTGIPSLNFEVLHAVRAAVPVPLVLHGGSGSGDANLHRCATEGITKINIFTDFLIGAMRQIEAAKPDDYIGLKQAANAGMAGVLRHYFRVFSHQGR